MKIFRKVVFLAYLLCLGAFPILGHAVAPAFQHPLDVPALQSPLALTSPLIAVARAGHRLVAVGWRGHIAYSDDQGKTWSQASVPVSVDLIAVSFPSASQGWAVGHAGVILHTRDGGKTWLRQADGRDLGKTMLQYYEQRAGLRNPVMLKALDDAKANTQNGPELPWLGVHFLNERDGYVVGAFNSIMKTDDGGKSWTPWMDRIDNPNGFHLNAISAVGDDLFIAAEQGTVFKLDRSKQRFLPIPTGYRGSFFGVTGSGRLVLAYGLGGTAYRSVDSGQTWQKVETGVSGGINGATVLPDTRIVLATQDGKLLLSSNEGAQFSQMRLKDSMLFAGVAAIDAARVVAVGLRGTMVVDVAAAQ